jgi:hypothetical protein
LFTVMLLLLLPVRASLSQIVYSILCSVPSFKDTGGRRRTE